MPKLSPKGKLVAALVFLSILSLVYILSSPRPGKPLPFLPVSSTPTPADIRSNQPAFNRLKKFSVSFGPDLTFTGFPQNFPVYSAFPSPEDLDSVTATIAAYFHLSRTSPTSRTWFSKDQTRSLLQNFKTQTIFYSTDRTSSPSLYSGPSKPGLTGALAVAQKFIAGLPVPPGLAFEENSIQYLAASEFDTEFHSSDPTNAEVILLPFSYHVDNYVYRSGALLDPPLMFYIGQRNQIIKLSYLSQPLPRISSPTEHSSIASDDIKNLLESGQGEVVSTDLLNLAYQTSQLPPVNITSYHIEYRLNTAKNLLLPYFRFEGTFTSPQNQQPTPVSILLPAVSL